MLHGTVKQQTDMEMLNELVNELVSVHTLMKMCMVYHWQSVACITSKQWYFLEMWLRENKVHAAFPVLPGALVLQLRPMSTQACDLLRIRSRAGWSLQQKAAVKLASVGPNGGQWAIHGPSELTSYFPKGPWQLLCFERMCPVWLALSHITPHIPHTGCYLRGAWISNLLMLNCKCASQSLGAKWIMHSVRS